MNVKYKNEENLIRACRKNDRWAQKELYQRFIHKMYSTVFRYTFSKQDTEDILQTGFTKVFQYLSKFDPQKGTLEAWIRKICIRCALDNLNQKKIRYEELSSDHHALEDQNLSLAHLENEYLLDLISSLEPRQRMIFNLREVEGYSYKEISKLLNISPKVCRVFLSRAKKKLRERITTYKANQTIFI